MRAFLVGMALVGMVGVGGCAGTGTEVGRRVETMPAAASVGAAKHLAYWIQRDLTLDTRAPADQKAELLAGATTLEAQADRLSLEIAAYDAGGPAACAGDVRARTAALDDRHRALTREWRGWRARHGHGAAAAD